VLIRVKAADFDSVVGRRNDTRARPILIVVVTFFDSAGKDYSFIRTP
jgi:hypothetical protein